MKETEDFMDHNPNPKIWKDSLKKNPFVVPKNYFEQLLDQSSYLSHLPLEDESCWNVPSDYFDQLQNQIQSRISIEEVLLQSGQTQTTENHQHGFQVSDGYFAQLNTKIKLSITSEINNPTHVKFDEIVPKTIKLSKNRVRIWARYAAAACLLLTGTLFIQNWNSRGQSELENIPDQDIINYLSTFSTTSDWVQISNVVGENSSSHSSLNPMNDLDEDEIRWFLENTL